MANNPCDNIVETLYVGNSNALSVGKPFDMVINCTNNIPFPVYTNCEFIRIPIDDIPEDSYKLYELIKYTKVLEKIHEKLQEKKKVLVHCFAGMQRSCALVACYLIRYYNASPIESIQHIRKYRPIAFFGGVNFMDAIEKYYEKHRKKIKAFYN